MKIFKVLFIVFIAIGLTISCKENKPKETAPKTETISKEASLQKITLNIEGMTCEIGCAKTIESKLSKMAGIQSAKIVFDEKIGEIVFDVNQITKEDIKKKITGIGNGELYTVSNTKEIEL
jgi:Cu+-exporting ATPase